MLALFNRSRDAAAAPKDGKKRAKAAAGATLLVERCEKIGAPLPPSLLALCAGLTPPREGLGFNTIAVQLCIAAHAFSVDVDTLIDLCTGLTERHESDSTRYNTVAKRRDAIRELYRYTQGYEMSVGGIRSILSADLPANDLRGL
jgi:hypothetical protein